MSVEQKEIYRKKRRERKREEKKKKKKKKDMCKRKEGSILLTK
jgi:hypothetical protein